MNDWRKTVVAATLLPTKVLGMFDTDGLDAVAESVKRDLKAIMGKATAGKKTECSGSLFLDWQRTDSSVASRKFAPEPHCFFMN